MSRLCLLLLLVFSLFMTCGCAMKSAKSSTTAPALSPSSTATATTSDPRGGEQGQIREETILAAPPTISIEPLAPLEKPVLAGLQPIPFSYDQHLLSEEARNIIAANAAILRGTTSKVKFQLAGHCDERGSDQYNIALGERRSEAVRTYLLELGIDADRMETVSYGEEQPLDTGHDESAWAKNRRVDFVLLP